MLTVCNYIRLSLLLFLLTTSTLSLKSQLKDDVMIEGSLGSDVGHAILFVQEVLNYENYFVVNQGNLSMNFTPPYTVTQPSLIMTGVGGEYMVTDKIGIGGNIYYSKLEFDIQSTNPTASVHIAKSKTLITPKIVFHLSPGIKWFDVYFPLMAGFKINRYNISTQLPQYVGIGENQLPYSLAFRAAFGLRFFPSKYIGINIEPLGLGGALVQFGITIKIPSTKPAENSPTIPKGEFD
ncbi:MAG: hypothetical protein KDC83_10585 [Flavobacteriales bacterium]|nr:hypothetical protein [Flavobacteriales bacterium]